MNEPHTPHVPHVEEELLQRHYDGDLEGEAAHSVMQHLAQCEQCQQRHEALNGLHRLMLFAAEQGALDVDFGRSFAQIERGIRNAPLEAPARSAGALPHKTPSLLERLGQYVRDLVSQRPEQLWAPAMGAALAAFVLFFALRDEQPAGNTTAANEPAPAVVPPAPAPPPEPALPDTALALASTEIVQVDFGSNAGTVYEIALAEGVSTPVVWINDDVTE